MKTSIQKKKVVKKEKVEKMDTAVIAQGVAAVAKTRRRVEESDLTETIGKFAQNIFAKNKHELSKEDFQLPPDAWVPGLTIAAMGTEFTELPFAMPIGDDLENRIKINEILRFSLKQQRRDEIFDNPAVVTHLISRCLTAAGFDNKIAYGYRTTMPRPAEGINVSIKSRCDARESRVGLWRSPQVWLIIDGHIIDNTYIYDMPEKCSNYLIKHTPACYEESTFGPSDPSLSLDDDDGAESADNKDKNSAQQVITVMKKRIEFCMRSPDKALALSHNREQFYNYFFAMIRYMYNEHGVSVCGIDPNIRLRCWWCDTYPEKGKDLYSDTLALRINENQDCETPVNHVSSLSGTSWRLLQCSRCMVASYCSKNCQRRDWLDNHRATCLTRGSVMLPPISNVPYGGAC